MPIFPKGATTNVQGQKEINKRGKSHSIAKSRPSFIVCLRPRSDGDGKRRTDSHFRQKYLRSSPACQEGLLSLWDLLRSNRACFDAISLDASLIFGWKRKHPSVIPPNW
ncbi:hypothetical protein CDAR_491501 [Caerostris darwini]|uniref:Uncharacterized protein n=1 Tax=Caerostris darwini TaxID=1538125 RepID=A0AAV4X6P9_9ARAC|nr:hypothetical protein CDAR_491501 [Caerostris darwini]